MRYRGALIGLSLFMIVAVMLTWLVYVTLRRDVAGKTVPYAALFSDVFGLREGDDVRMAGVRVGRVEKIELQGDLAKVSFVVQSNQQLLGTTVASVTYQNIVGQRYLGLSLGKIGDPGQLPAESVIPVDRTDPSFDVGTLLNGYEPLFSVLNPRDADNLTKGVIQSLQGDEASIAALVDQTSRLTESFAGRDEALGQVITHLNVVVDNLARHNNDLDQVITQARDMVSTFDARRPELVSSTGSVARVDTPTVHHHRRGLPLPRRAGEPSTRLRSTHGRDRTATGIYRRQSAVAAQGISAHHQRRLVRQCLRVRPEHPGILPRPKRRGADHRRCRHPRKQSAVHTEV